MNDVTFFLFLLPFSRVKLFLKTKKVKSINNVAIFIVLNNRPKASNLLVSFYAKRNLFICFKGS